MPIKRFVATKDTTITDAYQENNRTRGTNANMGEADSLEVFSLYSSVSASTVERSRALLQFSTDDIYAQRVSGNLPVSGNVEFYLRLFNVKHPYSVPRKFTLMVNALTQEWEEGYGLDMEGYTDLGYVSGTGGYGTTWDYAGTNSPWLVPGGSYYSGSNQQYSYYFETGLEDMTLNITPLVEEWMQNLTPNKGVILRLSESLENGSTLTSYYTKKFSARGSEFYMNRPCIEARWDHAIDDDRADFYAASNRLSPEDNTMSIFFYNRVEGVLKEIYGAPSIGVKLYSDPNFTNELSATIVTSNPQPGVHGADVIIYTTASVIYDKWYNLASTGTVYYSSSINVYDRFEEDEKYEVEYILNITNLKPFYSQEEKAKLNIFARAKDWQPTIYSVAYNNIETERLDNLYYKVFRLNDNYTIIDYSTGSLGYSKVSHDVYGNHFELDMNIFEKDYGYGIKLATWDGAQLNEFKETFKFRIK